MILSELREGEASAETGWPPRPIPSLREPRPPVSDTVTGPVDQARVAKELPSMIPCSAVDVTPACADLRNAARSCGVAAWPKYAGNSSRIMLVR